MCTKRSDLHHIMNRFDENDVRVLEISVSPMFASKKQVVLNVDSTHEVFQQ